MLGSVGDNRDTVITSFDFHGAHILEEEKDNKETEGMVSDSSKHYAKDKAMRDFEGGREWDASSDLHLF